MYLIKEQLKDGRVIIVATVGSKQEAETWVANARLTDREVWYVRE